MCYQLQYRLLQYVLKLLFAPKLMVPCLPAAPLNPTDPSKPNPAWKFPITGLGPFGPNSKCVGDNWPAGHCTLSSVRNLAAPDYWDDPGSANSESTHPAGAGGSFKCTAAEARTPAPLGSARPVGPRRHLGSASGHRLPGQQAEASPPTHMLTCLPPA